MLARLAVHYLTADPAREGLLIRERSMSFAERRPTRQPKPQISSRDDLWAWISQQHEARLAEVGGNEALLRLRRADAVWLDITDPQRPLVEVHEIKVSRADLVAELRRPEKAAVWVQQAHAFWLTVPDPALIDGLTLPEGWGVLALPFGAVPTVVRPAPALHPREPIRQDLADYVHRNAQTTWRWDGETYRAVSGRYTVASHVVGSASGRLDRPDGPNLSDPGATVRP